MTFWLRPRSMSDCSSVGMVNNICRYIQQLTHNSPPAMMRPHGPPSQAIVIAAIPANVSGIKFQPSEVWLRNGCSCTSATPSRFSTVCTYPAAWRSLAEAEGRGPISLHTARR